VLHTRRYEQHTTIFPDGTYAKDIAKFNHPLGRTILVDDNDYNAPKLHPDNVVPAPKFNVRYASNFIKAETDDFLPKLTAYLRELASVPDVRVPLREKFKISESKTGKFRNFTIYL
jgi:TFIIF-interacting CTD phosphatase-like protein